MDVHCLNSNLLFHKNLIPNKKPNPINKYKNSQHNKLNEFIISISKYKYESKQE